MALALRGDPGDNPAVYETNNGIRMTSTREPLPGRTMPRSLVMVSSVAAAPAMALLEAIVATMEVMVGDTVDLLHAREIEYVETCSWRADGAGRRPVR